MATTTNYAWETPDDTDLVKDGAAAIRTLGSSVDATTKALNPSTTLGDIEYRSSTANTNTRLAIGSTGNVLTVAGGVPTWAAPAGGGKVLQVVSDSDTADTTINSTSFTDTNLSVTITPSSASSKILILSFFRGNVFNNATATVVYGESRLLRGATQIQGHYAGVSAQASSVDPRVYYSISYVCLDNPNTTSATTYKIQNRGVQPAASMSIDASGGLTAYLIAMEIGA